MVSGNISTMHPELNMDGWGIIDFELALYGTQLLKDAAIALQNQPRATKSGEAYHLGAEFIVDLGEDYIASIITAIVERLAEVRFRDAEDEERRQLLWLSYEAGFGRGSEPIEYLISQVQAWREERP